MTPQKEQENQPCGIISGRTLIPLGLCVLIFVAAVQVTWSASKINSRIENNTSKIDKQDRDIKELQKSMIYLEKGMIRIETKLGTLPKPEDIYE